MDAERLQQLLGSNRYRVERLLGRGGMSTVWLATDNRDHRQVAIKLLNQELGDNPEFRQRFRNEASAAQSVNSPNVVSIDTYEEGTSNGHGACYIVMEYIRGESLSEVLRRRTTLPEHLALDVVEQTAHGLSAIHAANLIHRDIKPGNLLVTPEGTVKITDFGIAKAAETVPLTRTGMVVGTAQYVSPEQAQGKQVTPATDVYSLGCVAYEMLAGRRPFQGDSTVAVAVAHINQPPQVLPPTVHPHIRELVGIMLRKDPQRRYADGRELAAAVHAVRTGSRPPQPRGVQPIVYQQSDSANPATSELGAMTRPNARAVTRPAPRTAVHPAARPGGRTAARPAAKSTPSRPPRKSSGLGCAVLFILLALLAAAVAIVISMLQGNQFPGFGTSGSATSSTTQSTPSDESPWNWQDSQDNNDGSGSSSDWDSGNDTSTESTDGAGQGDSGTETTSPSNPPTEPSNTQNPPNNDPTNPGNSSGNPNAPGNSGGNSGNNGNGNNLPSLNDFIPNANTQPSALGNGMQPHGGAVL